MEQYQTIEQLTARVCELEAENVKLKAESRDACLGLSDYYSRKLAAEQLNNKLLREDQELLIEAWNYGQFADDFDQPQAKPVRAAIRRFCEALATPISTEALDKYVAAKVKEYGDEARRQMQHATKAVWQRDLAVEAVREALECGEDGDWQSARRILASVIKESEAN